MIVFNKLLFDYFDALDKVAGIDIIDYVEPFDHLAEAGVHAVEMLSVGAVVADEELAAACVFACMGHGEYAAVVILFFGLGFAFDMPAGAAGAYAGVAGIAAIGASALNDETGDDAMEAQTIVEAIVY